MWFIHPFCVVYPAFNHSTKIYEKVNFPYREFFFIINIRLGKKIKSDTISERLQLYGIQSHLSRATFFSIRGFLKKNLMETPQIISDSVGDKQNVSFFSFAKCFQKVSRRGTLIVLQRWCTSGSPPSCPGETTGGYPEIWTNALIRESSMISPRVRGYSSPSRTKWTRKDFKGHFSIISKKSQPLIWSQLRFYPSPILSIIFFSYFQRWMFKRSWFLKRKKASPSTQHSS